MSKEPRRAAYLNPCDAVGPCKSVSLHAQRIAVIQIAIFTRIIKRRLENVVVDIVLWHSITK
jgi:hypothetical protein